MRFRVVLDFSHFSVSGTAHTLSVALKDNTGRFGFESHWENRAEYVLYLSVSRPVGLCGYVCVCACAHACMCVCVIVCGGYKDS